MFGGRGLTVLLTLIGLIRAWNLTHLNIEPNYYISSVSVYRSRAFLCLPRFANRTTATLIEAPWSGGENSYAFRTRAKVYPSPNSQILGDCTGIQSCRSIDTDSRGRLWILDSGDGADCPAKVVVFNLYYGSELQRGDLTDVSGSGLDQIVVDPVISYEYGSRAYVTNPAEGQLIVYALKERRWWRLKMVAKGADFVEGALIALSRRESSLFVTGRQSNEIYLYNLNNIRRSPGPPAVIGNTEAQTANVSLVGNKLGYSSGLVVDYKGGLNYYLIRDFAVVRWDTKKPLVAENHNILIQSAETLPSVSQLFIGPQYGVWAVVNPPEPGSEAELAMPDDHIVRRRCIRVMKYSVLH